MNIANTLLIAMCALATTACTHIARLEDLPVSAKQVPFEAAAQAAPRGNAVWTQETKFEHYIELGSVPLDALHKRLEESMVRAGYRVQRTDRAQEAVVGSRGLTLMEWGSVAGIYYRSERDRVQVYVRVHVTQDVTGSPRHNPAWDVGDEVCREVGFCRVRR